MAALSTGAPSVNWSRLEMTGETYFDRVRPAVSQPDQDTSWRPLEWPATLISRPGPFTKLQPTLLPTCLYMYKTLTAMKADRPIYRTRNKQETQQHHLLSKSQSLSPSPICFLLFAQFHFNPPTVVSVSQAELAQLIIQIIRRIVVLISAEENAFLDTILPFPSVVR